MKILIPMAGEGSRFKEQGYMISKPCIPTYDRKSGNKIPMVVCATKDLPELDPAGENILYIDRDFHHQDGTENAIKKHFPKAKFITVNRLTEGQACTCLLAEDEIDNEEELLIAGCDNGMEMNLRKFFKKKNDTDMLVFTYRHNQAVLKNPNAYGWVIVDETGNIKKMSVKKPISNTPMEDHAVVATFWFRKGSIFVEAAKRMIAENDRINGEFYVDQVVNHVLELGYRAKVYEIERYIGCGTPEDYENYQKTFEYWYGFCRREQIVPKSV